MASTYWRGAGVEMGKFSVINYMYLLLPIQVRSFEHSSQVKTEFGRFCGFFFIKVSPAGVYVQHFFTFLAAKRRPCSVLCYQDKCCQARMLCLCTQISKSLHNQLPGYLHCLRSFMCLHIPMEDFDVKSQMSSPLWH